MIVSKVGRELYEKFFRNYTRKQWGLDPSELDASVTARVPTRTNRDDRYFTDTYQAMPLHGYTRMFERMLDHPNIKIMLNTDYREIEDVIPYRRDDLHRADRRVLRLPLRQAAVPLAASSSSRRSTQPVFQPAPVVNYPNEHPYTRVTEFKYLTGPGAPQDDASSTSIRRPRAIRTTRSRGRRTRRCTSSTRRSPSATPDVHFVGRLGTYKYYNMDQVVAQALALYRKLSGDAAGRRETDRLTPARCGRRRPCRAFRAPRAHCERGGHPAGPTFVRCRSRRQ